MDADDPDVEDGDAEDGDAALVVALRAGDEAAFATLIDRYYGTMLRVARMYVATKEAAEDVVQETLLGVVQGIDRFEGRSSRHRRRPGSPRTRCWPPRPASS